MLIKELKCQCCGRRFEAKVLDRENPREERVHGNPVRCPSCRSTLIEEVRVLRRAS